MKRSKTKAECILQAHLRKAEKEFKETGSSDFLRLYEEYATTRTFRKYPYIAVAAGYIPTNTDILAFVCSMPSRKVLKEHLSTANFYWDGIDTTFYNFIKCIGPIIACCVLLTTPFTWPISYLILRYSLFSKAEVSNRICTLQHELEKRNAI